MTKETTKPTARLWVPAEHLQSDEDMAAYLEAALEENDASLFAAALGDIARAKGMAQLARETGLGRKACTKPFRLPETPNSRRFCASSGRWDFSCMQHQTASRVRANRVARGFLASSPHVAAHVPRR